jgi:hypothetical protein
LLQIGVGVVYPNWIGQLGAHGFLEVKIGVVPKEDTTADEPVMAICSQSRVWLHNLRDVGALGQTAFDGCEMVIDDHAEIGSCFMNWRTGSDVK